MGLNTIQPPEVWKRYNHTLPEAPITMTIVEIDCPCTARIERCGLATGAHVIVCQHCKDWHSVLFVDRPLAA